MDSNPSIAAIAVLIDDMRSDIASVRLDAVKQADAIALALGPERTREELIPFLLDMLDDESDVLVAVCESLRAMKVSIGGEAHFGDLLKAFEPFATLEDPSVRESAISGLRAVIADCAGTILTFDLQPMIIRLSISDWHVARSAACLLIGFGVIRGVQLQSQEPQRPLAFIEEVLGTLQELSRDETPMVRRACLLGCTDILSRGYLVDEVGCHIQSALNDEDEAVRCIVPQLATQIMNEGGCFQLVTEIITKACADPSWRVRQACVSALSDWLGFANENLVAHVHKALIAFLNDADTDVKAQAVAKLPEYFAAIEGKPVLPDSKAVVIGLLPSLGSDTSQEVRLALAESFRFTLTCSPAEFAKNFLPIYLTLIRDNESVRLKALNLLPKLLHLISAETVKVGIMQEIDQLVENDHYWRARVAAISISVALVAGTQDLGVVKADQTVLDAAGRWYQKLLADRVFTVREEAALALPKFCKHAGAVWTDSVAWPLIEDLLNDPKYSTRISGVMSLAALVEHGIKAAAATAKIAEMLDDKVANVRLACLTATQSIAETSGSNWNKIKQKIVTIAESESDPAVSSLARNLIAAP